MDSISSLLFRLALCSTLVLLTKTVDAEDLKIYGGYPIEISQAPYMVHITYAYEVFSNGTAKTYNCGGTILRKNLILTAGHCEYPVLKLF